MASVKVRDGLVLGTDSMTTIIGAGGNVLKTYANAKKLFQVGEFPVGVMTWGAGNLGQRSIGGLIREFGQTLTPEEGASVETVADRLYGFMRPQYDQAFPGATPGQGKDLGLFVSGYSEGQPLGEEFEFLLPRDGTPKRVRAADQMGSAWRGVDRPFTRLAQGVDPAMIAAFKAKGASDAEVEQILSTTRLMVAFDGMPVQDAVNYCAYILDTTIGYSAFHWGSQACARPLQIASILPDDGFRWIARPRFTHPSMEPIRG